MSKVSVLDVLLLTPGPRGRAGLPAILWGMPGSGKTSKVESACKRHDIPLETVILSIREPADVGGLPVVGPEGVRLEPPSWAKRLSAKMKDGGDPKGVCFLDELSCGAPAVQAAALRVVCEGVVGDHSLPPSVRVLAASNPEEASAGGWTLAAPLANRMLHVDIAAPTGEEWSEWMAGDAAPDESPVPVLVPDAWASAWAAARSNFAAFARRFPDKLLVVPNTDAERGRAWPSPRSMELAARAWAGCRALGAGDGTALRMVQAAVGDGVAGEIFAWLRALDIPDPEDVLSGSAKVPKKRVDQTFASLAGVVAASLLDRKDRNDRIVRALEVAGVVAKDSADVAASCVRPICRQAVLGPLFKDGKTAARIGAVLQGPLKQVADALGGRFK